MSVWRDVIGQESALAVLRRAVADPAMMTHAWLFTGPPGSGRSVAAKAFAGALLCPTGGCGECRECRTAVEGTHADVDVLATDRLQISVATTRELEQLVLAGHDTSRPHRKKERIPPGPAARAAAEVLRTNQQPDDVMNTDVVIDLSKYDRAAHGRNTLT